MFVLIPEGTFGARLIYFDPNGPALISPGGKSSRPIWFDPNGRALMYPGENGGAYWNVEGWNNLDEWICGDRILEHTTWLKTHLLKCGVTI